MTRVLVELLAVAIGTVLFLGALLAAFAVLLLWLAVSAVAAAVVYVAERLLERSVTGRPGERYSPRLWNPRGRTT